MYHLKVSFSDFDNTELSELVWMESRLREQFEKEKDAVNKNNQKGAK